MVLPKLPDRYTAAPTLDALAENQRDLIEYLEQDPRSELRTLAMTGRFPLSVRTELETPRGVTVVHAFETSAPSTVVTVTALPSWQFEDGSIKISAISGLVAGTNYTVTLLITGDR